MSTRFVACPACARHVRAGDAVCPFCGANAPTPAPRRLLRGRLSRAALGAAGAVGAAVALADCSSGNTNVSSFYGAPGCTGTTCDVVDAAADTADVGTAVFYGIACPDGSCFPQPEASTEASASPDAATDGTPGPGDTGTPDGGSD